jgi:hypothetical protein
LLEKLKEFDKAADSREVTTTQWQIRYNLEAELEKIYSIEELHLRRQGGSNGPSRVMQTIAFSMELPVVEEGGPLSSI